MTPEKAYLVANNLTPGVIHRWASGGLPTPFMGGTVLLRQGQALPAVADVEAHEAVYDAAKAQVKLMNVWRDSMEATDAAMPRPVEDVIGTMSDTQKAKLPAYTADAYAAKVTLRGEKP